jgi:hypothetical protein
LALLVVEPGRELRGPEWTSIRLNRKLSGVWPMAEKRGFRIPFEFIPMPVDSITADPPLSLAELKILLYLLKQVRFGESPQPLTDDEILNGTFDQDGEREDQGCGLSRGAFKSGRKDLVDRGWLELESASTDKSRPRFIHRLVIENNRQTPGVKKRHLVSKNDTDNERHLVSKNDSAVSKNDSAVSKNDTSNNKEIESTYRNTSLERDKRPALLQTKQPLAQSERDSWDLRRWQEEMRRTEPQTGTYIPDPDATWRQRTRDAAFAAGLSPGRIYSLLKAHFPNDPNIDLLYEQKQLFGEESA